jgi:deoxyribonuclease V
VDAYYRSTGGVRAALVVAADLRFVTVVAERMAEVAEVAPYRPGEFAARELPAIQAVVTGAGRLDLLVVDGYVHLDADGRPGLGARVHAWLGAPVIGVAKTAFHTATHAIEVRRGQARRPLYVTAVGLPDIEAAAIVEQMSGRYRVPDALRRVDALTRASTTSPAATDR